MTDPSSNADMDAEPSTQTGRDQPDPVPSVQYLERAVFLPAADTLIIADCHLGKGAASRVEAPVDGGDDVRERLLGLVHETGPETLLIAGDLLHSFSTIPHGVDWHVTRLERAVADAGAELVVTPGNHDSMLEGVFDGPAASQRLLADGGTLVCHGHVRPDLSALDDPAAITRIVVGHDHPAISIGGRKLPCLLYGPGQWRGRDVVMLPAFTKSAAGVSVNDLRGAALQSPLIQDIGVCRPAVYDVEAREPRWFPPLERCRHLL